MGLKAVGLSCAAIGLLAAALHAQNLVRAPDPNDAEAARVIVTGNYLPAYDSPNTVSATKTDTLALDVPQSVHIVPRQLLDDQRDLKLNDAFRNVAGVNTNSIIRNFDQYRIRGFSGVGRTYVDGLLVDPSINFRRRFSASTGSKSWKAHPRPSMGKAPRTDWST